MNCFDKLGVDQYATEEDIARAFRERLAAMGSPPDEEELRELIDARDQALNIRSSKLPAPANINPIQFASEESQAVLRHQIAASTFHRSRKALVSKRVTPLVRLKTVAKIVAILAAALAAFSNENFNPYLETFLQSESEVIRQLADQALQEAYEDMEMVLTLRNPDYEELNARLGDITGSRRFAALTHLATTTHELHLVYGTETMDGIRWEVDQDRTRVVATLEHFFQEACATVEASEIHRLDPLVRAARRNCNRFADADRLERLVGAAASTAGGSSERLVSPISTVLLGLRPRENPALTPILLPIEQQLSQELQLTKNMLFDAFDDIEDKARFRILSENIFAISRELAFVAWLDDFGRRHQRPAAEAVQNRKQLTTLISLTLIAVSAMLAAAIPLLILFISRRTREIEWLAENLEDRAVVYALLSTIFGTHVQGNGWLSSDGPEIVKAWLNGEHFENDNTADDLKPVMSTVKSNMDAVQFHRLLTSSALQSGCLEEQFEHSGDGVVIRYVVSIPSTD